MYFGSIAQTVSTSSVTLICAYAGWKGGRAERWGAAMTFAAWMITPLAQNHHDLHKAQFGVLVVDLLYCASLLALALRSSKFWPLWAAGFYLLEVLMHVDMLVDTQVKARAYFVGMEIFSYLSLFALGYGAWRESPRLCPAAPVSP